MAYQQYIGARYVPKVIGQWNSSLEYDPLSVVSDGHGNSFISKKRVPKNTPLSDDEYWMKSSDYSAQVADLSQRMESAESDIQENRRLIDGMIPETLLSERKFLFQGDSYLLQSPSWGDLAASYLKLRPDQWRKLASSGAGFVTRGSGGKNFIEELTSFSATGITDVIVAAGANDRTQLPNNIKNAISQYYDKVKEKFGDNCKLWIAMCANSKTEGTLIWSFCYEAYKLGAIEAGAKFIGDASFAVSAYDEFIDYLHPSAAGSTNIAMCIANAIRGGTAIGYSKSVAVSNCTLLAGTYDGQVNARSIGNNDLVQYWILPTTGMLDIRFNPPVAWTNRNYYDLIQLPDSVLFAIGGVAYGQCICRFRSSETQQYISQDAKLRITSDGVLQISPSEGMEIDIMRCGNIFITAPMRRAV